MITNGRDGGPQRSSDDGRESAPAPLAEALGPRLGPAATFATTDHFNLVTFVRLVQSSMEEIAYAQRIGLLRTFYLRLSPELEPYLVTTRETRSAPSAWQLTLTAAGMVAVINSVVLAACAGLALEAAGVTSLAIPLACGALIGAGAFSLHERHHRHARSTSSPEAVDLAAILVSPLQRARTEFASGSPSDPAAPGG